MWGAGATITGAAGAGGIIGAGAAAIGAGGIIGAGAAGIPIGAAGRPIETGAPAYAPGLAVAANASDALGPLVMTGPGLSTSTSLRFK